jgi:hypothetical protein
VKRLNREAFVARLLLNVLLVPNDQHAHHYLKELREQIRETEKEGKWLLEYLFPDPRRGRKKGHSGAFWRETWLVYVAHRACGCSRKEILFHLGKLDRPADVPTPSQYRDLRDRMNAAEKVFQNPDADDSANLVPLLLYLKPMSLAQRKAWAIESFRKLKTA